MAGIDRAVFPADVRTGRADFHRRLAADLGDLSQADGRLRFRVHHEFFERIEFLFVGRFVDPSERTDEDLIRPLPREEAAGHVLAALLKRLFDLFERDPVLLHLLGPGLDLELLDVAADDQDLRNAGDFQQLLADRPVGDRAKVHRV